MWLGGRTELILISNPPPQNKNQHYRRQKGKGAKLANDISYCTSPMLRTPARRAILSSLYLPQVYIQ